MRLASAEKRNMELKQQLNLSERKFLDTESEIRELNEKITELTALLKEVNEENALSRGRFDVYEDRIGHLESSLSKSFSRNSELEKELNDLVNKRVKREDWVTATHNHSLELEDLIDSSHSRAEDAEREQENWKYYWKLLIIGYRKLSNYSAPQRQNIEMLRLNQSNTAARFLSLLQSL